MRNNPTSGTNTGLPAGLARRSFLAALPAIFGAAAASSAPSTAALTAQSPSPGIAELAETVAFREARYLTARSELLAAVKKWEPAWPVAPESIRLPYAASLAPAEVGVDGEIVLRDGRNSPYGVRTLENVETLLGYAVEQVEKRRAAVAKSPTAYRRKELDRAEKHLAIARRAQTDCAAYHAECKRILELSGAKALYEASLRAANDLVAAVRAILGQGATNGADVAAQAAAVASLASLRGRDRMAVVLSDMDVGNQPMVLMLARAVAGLGTA